MKLQIKPLNGDKNSFCRHNPTRNDISSRVLILSHWFKNKIHGKLSIFGVGVLLFLRRDNFINLGISCQNMFTDKEYHLNSTRLHLNIGRE